jgi:hypothetical protein
VPKEGWIAYIYLPKVLGLGASGLLHVSVSVDEVTGGVVLLKPPSAGANHQAHAIRMLPPPDLANNGGRIAHHVQEEPTHKRSTIVQRHNLHVCIASATATMSSEEKANGEASYSGVIEHIQLRQACEFHQLPAHALKPLLTNLDQLRWTVMNQKNRTSRDRPPS